MTAADALQCWPLLSLPALLAAARWVAAVVVLLVAALLLAGIAYVAYRRDRDRDRRRGIMHRLAWMRNHKGGQQ